MGAESRVASLALPAGLPGTVECLKLVYIQREKDFAQLCLPSAVWYFTSMPRFWLWPGRQICVCHRRLRVWLLVLIWGAAVGECVGREVLLVDALWFHAVLTWLMKQVELQMFIAAMRSCTVL